MNDVLKPFIRRFVLVFFDDILIFSPKWAEHLQHVRTVMQQLRDHHLFAKRSKCFFSESSVAYLGHIISAARVSMDGDKVAVVEAWPRPRSARALRGFLGLITSYYRKFIAGYGGVAAPLTALLKWEAFSWNNTAEAAFLQLKKALMSAHYSSYLILASVSSLTTTPRAPALARCCIKVMAQWPSSARLWPPITPSYWLMRESSLAWSRPSITGDRIYGVVLSQFAQITRVSSTSSTSSPRQFLSTRG